MPFESPQLRPFTDDSIRAHAPTGSGLYGISDGSHWIYIGQSDCIQDSLLSDLQNAAMLMPKRTATQFAYEVCAEPGRLARQDWLVLEREPTCNRFSWPSREPAAATIIQE